MDDHNQYGKRPRIPRQPDMASRVLDGMTYLRKLTVHDMQCMLAGNMMNLTVVLYGVANSVHVLLYFALASWAAAFFSGVFAAHTVRDPQDQKIARPVAVYAYLACAALTTIAMLHMLFHTLGWVA